MCSITLTAQSKTQDSTFKRNVAANVLLQVIQDSAFRLQFLCGYVKSVLCGGLLLPDFNSESTEQNFD